MSAKKTAVEHKGGEQKPPALGVVIVAGLSPTIPDATPDLLERRDGVSRTVLERFALRIHTATRLAPIIIALPQEDAPLVEASGINHRLPPDIHLVYGHSRDVVRRVAWVMEKFHLDHILKLRGKDVLADPGLNAELIAAHLARRSDVTNASGCANGLCGLVLSRGAVEALRGMPHPGRKAARFADLWNPQLRLERHELSLQLFPDHDFTFTDKRDLRLVSHALAKKNLTPQQLVEIESKFRLSEATYRTILLPQIMETIQRSLATFLRQRPALPTLVCLAAHVWDEIPQRNHHLARRLAKHFNVVFIESATTSVRTIARTDTPPAAQAQEIAAAVCRETERILLIRAPLLRNFNIHNRDPRLRDEAYAFYKAVVGAMPHAVLLVYFPQYWDFIERGLGHTGPVVYDCCDEFRAFSETWPDIPQLETSLAKRADLVFASSERLRGRLAKLCHNTALIPNGVEFENMVSHHDGVAPRQLEHPVIGFIGGIAEWFDQELVCRVARMRPQWQFVLYGPVLWTDVSKLRKERNIHLLGALPHVLIPHVLRSFDVCMIPFKINDLTRSVDPVKLYEYLGAGKPVVSTPLPDVVRHKDMVFIGATPSDFRAAIERAFQSVGDQRLLAERRRLASARDWDTLGATMSETIAAMATRVAP